MGALGRKRTAEGKGPEDSTAEDLGALKKKGYFSSANVNRYGHGTFLKAMGDAKQEIFGVPEATMELWPVRQLADHAYSLKKKGDTKFKENREEGYRLWMLSVLVYARAYLKDEQASSQGALRESLSKNWQGLKTFVESIFPIIQPSEVHARKAFQEVLSNISYHSITQEIQGIRASMERGTLEGLSQGVGMLEQKIDDLVRCVERASRENTRLTPLGQIDAAQMIIFK